MRSRDCPFCGASEHLQRYSLEGVNGSMAFVICERCRAHGPATKGDEEAQKLWDGRAPSEHVGACPFCASTDFEVLIPVPPELAGGEGQEWLAICDNCYAVGPKSTDKEFAMRLWCERTTSNNVR